jgi:hypothetical protein
MLSVLVQALLMLLPTQVVIAETDAEFGQQATSKIDYRFVGHTEQSDSRGRLLVWEATVTGALNGTMKWWFENPPPVSEATYSSGRTSYYAAKWEYWADGELRLAGVSSGRTVFNHGVDGIWDGHGRVTIAKGRYASLQGRMINETGPVVLGTNPPQSLSGTGMFTIY